MATYKLTQIATDYICIFLRISNTNYMQFVAAYQSIWYAVRRVPSGMARYVYRITSVYSLWLIFMSLIVYLLVLMVLVV